MGAKYFNEKQSTWELGECVVDGSRVDRWMGEPVSERANECAGKLENVPFTVVLQNEKLTDRKTHSKRSKSEIKFLITWNKWKQWFHDNWLW